MIIRGQKVLGHYWLPCFLVCSNPEIAKPLQFVVDTGASSTTLVANVIELDYDGLDEGRPVMTANGIQVPRIIRDAIILFRTSKGKIYPIEIECIDVINLDPPPFDGLLGMDILSQFDKINLRPKSIYLEK